MTSLAGGKTGRRKTGTLPEGSRERRDSERQQGRGETVRGRDSRREGRDSDSDQRVLFCWMVAAEANSICRSCRLKFARDDSDVVSRREDRAPKNRHSARGQQGEAAGKGETVRGRDSSREGRDSDSDQRALFCWMVAAEAN